MNGSPSFTLDTLHGSLQLNPKPGPSPTLLCPAPSLGANLYRLHHPGSLPLGLATGRLHERTAGQDIYLPLASCQFYGVAASLCAYSSAGVRQPCFPSSHRHCLILPSSSFFKPMDGSCFKML